MKVLSQDHLFFVTGDIERQRYLLRTSHSWEAVDIARDFHAFARHRPPGQKSTCKKRCKYCSSMKNHGFSPSIQMCYTKFIDKEYFGSHFIQRYSLVFCSRKITD